MKKLLVIPVMIVYLIAMSGIMIHVHYCGKELESWSLYASKKGCADGACGDESKKNDGCCKDKVISAKVNQDQNSVASFQFKTAEPAGVDVPVMPGSPIVPAFNENTAVQPGHQPNAPPGRRQIIALYKLHSSFIYYG